MDRGCRHFLSGFMLGLIFSNQHVNRRNHKQREKGPDGHPSDEHQADRIARGGACARHEGQREVSGNGGGAGHQDRPQPGHGGRGHGLAFGVALFLELVGELDDQDAVFRDQPDERDQADLAVDVERRRAEEREQQRARDRQRCRAGKDDERVAEALELRRQPQCPVERAPTDTTFPATPSSTAACLRANRT